MVNKVFLLGNFCADPEVRYTNSGTAVASIRLATNRKRKNADGIYEDETEFHSVVAWAKTAEFVGQYMRKGNKAYVEGRLQTRKWQDKAGNDRYTTEIIAENLQNLSPRGEGRESRGGQQNKQPSFPAPGSNNGTGGFGDGFDPTDTPF